MSTNSTGVDPLQIDGLAFVLLLLVLPLTSFGTMSGTDVLWWLGLALLVIGGVMTLVTEFGFDGGR